MKNTLKILLVLMLILCLLLCSCAPGPSADVGTDAPSNEPSAEPSQATEPSTEPSTEPPTDPPTEPPTEQPTDPDDPETAHIRALIKTYFSERTAFLQGKTSNIPSAIPAVVNDEVKHRDAINACEAVLLDTSYQIHSISLWDKAAIVNVTETVTYLIDGAKVQYAIPHEITVDCISFDADMLSSDGYYDEPVDFYSCSYIDPAWNPN